MRKDTETLARNFTQALAAHGVTPQGLLWPNAADLAARFEALLSFIDLTRYSPENPVRLLDLGCGPGFLLDYLAANGLLDRVNYTGADAVEATLLPAHARWPDRRFELRDVRDQPFDEGEFDYCLICGVFTARFENSYQDTEALAQGLLRAVWPSVTQGVVFNAMSKHVDWERDDLFHWPLDELVAFCKRDLSRHVALRLNYGLWETAALVLKEPVPQAGRVPAAWLTDQKSPAAR